MNVFKSSSRPAIAMIRAADLRESNLVYTIASPSFAKVREDPGYQEILARINP